MHVDSLSSLPEPWSTYQPDENKNLPPFWRRKNLNSLMDWDLSADKASLADADADAGPHSRLKTDLTELMPLSSPSSIDAGLEPGAYLQSFL